MRLAPLKIHILWHLHQPIYRLAHSQRYILPWVRLHAIKAYYDMAKVAMKFPQLGITFNLTASLLEQLLDYEHDKAEDYYLILSYKDPNSLTKEEKAFIVDKFFQCSWDTMIFPYPRYKELLNLKLKEGVLAFQSNDILDLQTYFNLAWFGFYAKKDFPEINELIKKGRNFSQADKEKILDIHKKILKSIIPLFKEMIKTQPGIEISTTPYYHPILPLVYNTEAARISMPQWPMPEQFSFPADAVAQVKKSIDLYESLFQEKPKGFWPAEGSVSPEVANIFIENNVQWIATDEEIIQKTLHTHEHKVIFKPFTYKKKLRMFFRDKGISDAIGFKYSKMSTDAAIKDFFHNLNNIALDEENEHISIILDGENPWEYYADGGEQFLNALYTELISNKLMIPVAMRDGVIGDKCQNIDSLYSASWINGNFQIWIGSQEDNTAWNYLGKTRKAVEESKDRISLEQYQDAMNQIYVAEGSDWFWWYGDDFQSESKSDFDTLFRSYLIAARESMNLEIPAWLYEPILKNKSNQFSLFPKELIEPTLDGKLSSYYEWHGSVSYQTDSNASAIFNSQNLIDAIYWGYDLENLYLRFDFRNLEQLIANSGHTLVLNFFKQNERSGSDDKKLENSQQETKSSTNQFILHLTDSDSLISITKNDLGKDHPKDSAKKSPRSEKEIAQKINPPIKPEIAIGKIIEIKIPFSEIGAEPEETWEFFCELKKDKNTIEKQPMASLFPLSIPGPTFLIKNWFV